MDIDHIGVCRTLSHLAHTEDICHLLYAGQGAPATSFHTTGIQAPHTSHTPSNDSIRQPSNLAGCNSSGRNVDIRMRDAPMDGDKIRNVSDAHVNLEQL